MLFRIFSLTILLLALAPSGAQADGLFDPGSYRNTPLSSSAPLDPLSSLYVQDLASKASQIGAHVSLAYGYPVYVVGPDQPTVRVTVDDPGHQQCSYGSPCLLEQWSNVPLPAEAVGSSGTDGHLIVHQPSTDTVWEFWKFQRTSGTPHAYYGGRIERVSTNPGYFTESPGTQFGAAATSIPLLVGLQRIAELQAGAIDHVVSFAMADPHSGFRFPAQRGDGLSFLPNAAPEGACFRLPANVNLSALGLTPYGIALARAVQRFGMVLTDRTTTGIQLFAEVPTGGTNPYDGANGIFGGLDDSGGGGGVLRNFPWSQLQTLRSGTC